MSRLNYIICNKCYDIVGKQGFQKHYKRCNGVSKNLRHQKSNKNNFIKEKDYIETQSGSFKCCYCGKESPSKGIKGHIWRKHTEQGKSHDPNTGYKSGTRKNWNYGLSKETDSRIAASALKVSRNQKGKKGRRHTEETKRKISVYRKEYLLKHPEKIPYLLSHSSKISYPEQYFLDCFKKYSNILFQFSVSRYKLDFSNVEKKLYVEIDGEQHYTDQKMILHDIERTKNLLNLGWIGKRIRWAHFQKLSFQEKKDQINEIIAFLVGLKEEI